MKKFVKNFRAAFKEPANETNKPLHQDKDVLDPKFIVVNPPNRPNPSPAPAPPYPLPDNKGIFHQNHNVQQDSNENVGTFGGFDSWMASFEPDPNARGVVEVAAEPTHGQYPQEVSEVLSLEEGSDPYSIIRLTVDNLKKVETGNQQRFSVLVIGPWFMTLAQVNRLLVKHGYQEMLSAKHGYRASRNWDGDKALPTELQIPVVDGPSRYDSPAGEGPLIGRNEQCGSFVDRLRRLRVRCHEGKVVVTSFPAELEISFNRTLRLPENGMTHNQPVRLGKISVNSIAGLSKKLEASGSQSLVDMARKGGVFFPLYQREAMFLSFKARQDAFAVRVFVGGVNAVSGLPWNSHPSGGYKAATQDYLSIPPQQFLDGVCVGKDVVKQFVAMPLGSGYSVEKQVTGKETVGGMQLEIVPGNRWCLYVPASDKLPQPGPYYPDPEQRAGSLSVGMVVLGEHPRAESTKKTKDELVDKSHLPVYLRQLYQSQVETYGQADNVTDFYPGMGVQMTAVYILHLTLQYTSHSYSQARIETVKWAPWWTLEKCCSEHEQCHGADTEAKASTKPLSELQLYHRGRHLHTGPLTLQELGVTDGEVIMVQEPAPSYGYSPSHSYGQQSQGIEQQHGYGYGHNPLPYPDDSYSSASSPAPGPTSQPQQRYYSQQSRPSAQSYSLSQPEWDRSSSQTPSYSFPQQSSQSPQSQGSQSYGSPSPRASAMPPAPSPSMSPPMQGSSFSPRPVAMAPSMAPPSMAPPSMAPPSMAPPSMTSPSMTSPSMTSPSMTSPSMTSPSMTSPSMTSPSMTSPSMSSPAPSYSDQTYGSIPDYGSRSSLPPPTPAYNTGPPRHPKSSSMQSQTGWAMGIAAGSRVRQAILPDPFPPSEWCKNRSTMLSVQIINSVAFESLTGMLPPSTPITPQMYLEQGLPFLASYEDGVTTDGAANLAGIKGVGEIDSMSGPIQLGSNVASAKNVGCTCCGQMLCDSILRPCNHSFCSSCIKNYMSFTYGSGVYTTTCRICNTRAEKLIGFSAPMALPGEDTVDLSEANIVTIQPFQGVSGFHSVHELSAVADDKSDGMMGGYFYHPYEMPG